MKPLFTEEQLNSMSKENIIALMQALQEHQQKQEREIQLLISLMKRNRNSIRMGPNRKRRKSIRLPIRGRNVPERKRRISPLFKQQK